jgi:hypothetical protein
MKDSNSYFEDTRIFINSSDFPFVVPAHQLYPTRRFSRSRRMGLFPQGFVYDGASGDIRIRRKGKRGRINIIRELDLRACGKHDLRYLLGGDLVLPPDAEGWRDADLVPISKVRADFEYMADLFNDHHYFAALVRFVALSFVKHTWEEYRADTRPWRKILAERMLPHPNEWEYDHRTWKLKDVRRR